MIRADDPQARAPVLHVGRARGARPGAARALVDAVAGWTAAKGARALQTAVTIGNEAAARLYARAGFVDTGRREPLGHSDAETAVLERPLDP